jgi:TolB-like protein
MRPLLIALSLLAPSAAAAAKPTVAILYFDYQGKDEQMGMLRKGLAQMLISDLSGSDRFQIVERDRLQEILDELKLAQSNQIDKSSAAKIGKLLGARYMVMGGYFDLMGTLRVDARVVEVETGKVIRSIGSNSKPDQFLDLQQKLSGELDSVLGNELKAGPGAPARQRPKAPKQLRVSTATKYSEALDAIDKKDAATAKKKLKEVLEEQPDFSLAQIDLKSLVQ